MGLKKRRLHSEMGLRALEMSNVILKGLLSALCGCTIPQTESLPLWHAATHSDERLYERERETEKGRPQDKRRRRGGMKDWKQKRTIVRQRRDWLITMWKQKQCDIMWVVLHRVIVTLLMTSTDPPSPSEVFRLECTAIMFMLIRVCENWTDTKPLNQNFSRRPFTKYQNFP